MRKMIVGHEASSLNHSTNRDGGKLHAACAGKTLMQRAKKRTLTKSE
jgi:hypothetical protein